MNMSDRPVESGQKGEEKILDKLALEKQYKLALENDPKDATMHYNYGTLLVELDRKEEAEIQYRLSLKINPKDVNAYYNYGLLLTEMDRKEEAEIQYKSGKQLTVL